MQEDGLPIPATLEVEAHLDSLRNKVFQIILGVAAITLAVVSIRAFLLEGAILWPDIVLLGITGVVGLVLRIRPAWTSVLSWVFLALLYLNMAGGLFPWSSVEVITPAHLLLPLLVLYGSGLGNLRMILVSALLAMGIYILTAVHYHPLSHAVMYQLTNLAILTLGSALVSYAVWRVHRVLICEIRAKKIQLQQQLEEKHRLQAILFHDLANPLTALQATVDMMHVRPCTSEDLSRMDRMIQRITKIISSVRMLTRSASGQLPLEPVLLAWVARNLQDLFQDRLRNKGLSLETDIPEDLVVTTHEDILVHSVLSNLLSNAIKFSARGSCLHIQARREGERVHVCVLNPGSAIPAEVLESLKDGKECASALGTEGERGLGLGLQIVGTTLQQLRGSLKVWNRPQGACLELNLPGACESAD